MSAMAERQEPMPGDSAAIHAAIEVVRRLSEVFELRRAQLAQAAGVTELEWRVLDEIDGDRFIPSLFARRRDSTPAAVSKITRQLLDKGLVTASISKVDRRQRDYELTAKGHRTVAGLLEQRERAIRAVWQRLDGSDVARFVEFGRCLASRLEEYARREAGAAGPRARRRE